MAYILHLVSVLQSAHRRIKKTFPLQVLWLYLADAMVKDKLFASVRAVLEHSQCDVADEYFVNEFLRVYHLIGSGGVWLLSLIPRLGERMMVTQQISTHIGTMCVFVAVALCLALRNPFQAGCSVPQFFSSCIMSKIRTRV